VNRQSFSAIGNGTPRLRGWVGNYFFLTLGPCSVSFNPRGPAAMTIWPPFSTTCRRIVSIFSSSYIVQPPNHRAAENATPFPALPNFRQYRRAAGYNRKLWRFAPVCVIVAKALETGIWRTSHPFVRGLESLGQSNHLLGPIVPCYPRWCGENSPKTCDQHPPE